MKIYLMPKAFRKGNPIITAIQGYADTGQYFISTYYNLAHKKSYKGDGIEYNAVHRIKISKELYSAFLKEAKANHKKFKVKK